MTFISQRILLDNPVVSPGGTLSGVATITLEKELEFTDITLRFRGVSYVYETRQNGSAVGYREYRETHTHVDLVQSFAGHGSLGRLSAGTYVYPFCFPVPLCSMCSCLSVRKEKYKSFKNMTLGWTCIPRTDDSTIACPLPGSFYGRKDMFVEYRLRLKIERLREKLSEKTADSVSVLLVPLPRELGSVPVWEAAAQTNSSAKCAKLPDDYFRKGSLTRSRALSGLFSKRHTYVNARSALDVRLPEGKVTILEPFEMHIFYSIDVDDVSQLAGILNLAVVSVAISLKSKAESTLYGFKGMASKNTATLFENTNCNIPIVFPDTAGRPRVRIDPLLFKAIQIKDYITPTFEIMSMWINYELNISVTFELNGENRATLEISRPVVVERPPQCNTGPNMGLDARLCAEKFIEDRDVFDY
ncbi:hypothetical protein V1508DRAFT_116459 [Lipomyces doorenjongii]|uniref:uncharacterized protein n=1 Tax=Lipomyces doorenjongii TaxID=383834 RepID=UPI0034CDAA17